MCRWKNFENRSIFDEDMDKSMRLSFFGPPFIYSAPTSALFVSLCPDVWIGIARLCPLKRCWFIASSIHCCSANPIRSVIPRPAWVANHTTCPCWGRSSIYTAFTIGTAGQCTSGYRSFRRSTRQSRLSALCDCSRNLARLDELRAAIRVHGWSAGFDTRSPDRIQLCKAPAS